MDGEGAVRGHGRDAQAGGDVEPDAFGQRNRTVCGQDGVFLRSAGGTFMGGEEDPHPVPHPEAGNALADGVDNSGSVLVGHHLIKRDTGACTGFPVGGIHPGDGDADPHFTGSGLRDAALGQGQD